LHRFFTVFDVHEKNIKIVENSKQIFQTDSKKRWRNVQWGSRIFIFIAILLFLALGLMMKWDRSPKFLLKKIIKLLLQQQTLSSGK
jgi:hypothetical protein